MDWGGGETFQAEDSKEQNSGWEEESSRRLGNARRNQRLNKEIGEASEKGRSQKGYIVK